MDCYPSEFSKVSIAKVEREIILAGRDFDRDRKARPYPAYSRDLEELVRRYILRILLAFATEAAEVAQSGVWSVDLLDRICREFLRRVTIRARLEKGSDSQGNSTIERLISDWGHLTPEAQRKFEAAPEWTSYTEILLAVADAHADAAVKPAALSQEPTLPKNKPGPDRDVQNASKVSEIVTNVAGGVPWRQKLDDICDALDEMKIPCPKLWRRRKHPILTWADAAATDRDLARKAIAHRLKIAQK